MNTERIYPIQRVRQQIPKKYMKSHCNITIVHFKHLKCYMSITNKKWNTKQFPNAKKANKTKYELTPHGIKITVWIALK